MSIASESHVLIIGTGGHARMVAEIVRASGRLVRAFATPPGQPPPNRVPQAPVLSWEEACRAGRESHAIVAIGDNLLRREISEAAEAAGLTLTTAVHPSATVGSGVAIGAGSVIAAGAILVLDVTVGRGAIVNTGAAVDHDCRIGDWCHVGPGATLAGSVALGDGVFVGAGGVVINNMTVGSYAVIGAGAVVVRDIPEKVVAVGVPASILRDGER